MERIVFPMKVHAVKLEYRRRLLDKLIHGYFCVKRGKKSVAITCDPDNEPSRKTCIGLGCLWEGITAVPEDLQVKYEISAIKCRYIWHMPKRQDVL